LMHLWIDYVDCSPKYSLAVWIWDHLFWKKCQW
jgi:hypothetical protein